MRRRTVELAAKAGLAGAGLAAASFLLRRRGWMDEGDRSKKGYESASRWAPSILTRLSDQ
jgi:hypothetical protein